MINFDYLTARFCIYNFVWRTGQSKYRTTQASYLREIHLLLCFCNIKLQQWMLPVDSATTAPKSTCAETGSVYIIAQNFCDIIVAVKLASEYRHQYHNMSI